MSKIQNLLHHYPPNVVLTSHMLSKDGYTPQLMQKYLKSGWVEKVGDGAYKRSHENVSWEGALWSLMQHSGDVYISGKTALELQGFEHFLNLGRRKIYVSHNVSTIIPKWLKTYDFSIDFVFIRSHNEISQYINDLVIKDFTLRVACPEMAALEICSGIPKYYTYDSALYFFESLATLRADVVQKLLEESLYIKAKRLFLYFSDNLHHDWFKEINLSRINLGSGKRQIVPGGKFDAQYLITVPRNFEKEQL